MWDRSNLHVWIENLILHLLAVQNLLYNLILCHNWGANLLYFLHLRFNKTVKSNSIVSNSNIYFYSTCYILHYPLDFR